MKTLRTWLLTWILATAVTLYFTFVFEMLWGWFVTTAFHFSEISFWNMFGLLLGASALQARTTEVVPIQKMNEAFIMLDACIPQHTRIDTNILREKEKLSDFAAMLVADALKAGSATLVLVVGWAVHAFLM
jgi:hypothetical protein